MSQQSERSDHRGALDIENGLETLRRSPEFHGPVDSVDGHGCNDHFAQLYESEAERLTASIPFVRHGLEQNERCLYIVDESTEADVKAAMQAADVDVDSALESGALSFHTVQDTYLRNGTFDLDEMVDFYADTVATATEEYEALRIVSETTWLQEDTATVEQFMEYEAKINNLFEDEDCLALCQYDRGGFPPEIIRNIVQTHPHLIHDGTVCHNVYYTPPEEFFGSDEPAREVDRMLRTLRERTAAKVELEDRQRYLRRLNEITASSDQTFEEKLQGLFELGCERFDLELGAMAHVDAEEDWFEVEYVSDDHDHFEPGIELPLSETYCTAAADIKAAGSVADPHEEGYDDIHVYQEFGIQAYLGTYIEVNGGPNRTFFFVTSASRAVDFSDDELEFVRLMGEWVKTELERRQRESFLRESYEITSNPARSFEEKLERLLDHGREWMDLDAAGLAHLPSWNSKFFNEYTVEYGDGDDATGGSDEMWTDSGEGCYCRQVIESNEPVGMADVRGTVWEADENHRNHGLTCFLGTKVMNGSTPYGTLWVGSTEPRDREFTETERTFLELIGQWVSYEIEQREHNQSLQELYEITADTDQTFEEKLQAVFDLGCEQFDMELGGTAIDEPATDRFEVEIVSGEHEHLVPGESYPLSETYCRVPASEGGTCEITDPVSDGFEGNLCYDQFGVRAYLGTYLEFEDVANRTFWFVSTEPREGGFSESEQTFQHLIGQWVKHEFERQQREQELRKRTEHLSALIETAPECIKTVAADGTLLQMNPAGLDMVEADSASDVTGECVYNLIAPEDRERFREFNERICQGESGALEFDIIGLEGTRRHMETHAAPLHRPDGTTVQVALTRDITDQVEREQQLAETVDQLQQSNDRLKQFAYAASHDLQEPLRMVSSYLQLLENQYKDDLDEDAQEYIDFAVDGADRMREMVTDLLAFSRVEQADGDFESVDCNSVLERVSDDLQMQIAENGAEITVKSTPTVQADSEQLEQVFFNLVSNAIKYNDDGPPQVEITVEERASHWEFAVADNGIGIDPEKTDRIFGVFKRLHHDKKYSGTGIGLSLCQEIVEDHGGDIWVDSEPGEGSTFFFTIPKQMTD